ncbi:MAG: PVC-type heme-binding CxxCH protein, partial [Verrucomicrobiota bacterium]
MNRNFLWLVVVIFSWATTFGHAQSPLRIFIRAGEKTHGPDQHDHPRFLAEGKSLLNERGAKADGGMAFPSATQLENTDVLVMYAAEAGTISPEERVNLEKFLKRGGGMVVIHDAVCGTDPQWFKTIIGGAWEHGHSKWYEGDVSLYVQDHSHPITKGLSNFDLDDEIYYDLHLMPEAKILVSSYAPDKRNTRDGKMLPSVYEIVPQMWVYEKTLEGGAPYRAFVSIPGHNHKTFELPHYRALLLRGIAWAGKRDVDSLCDREELASLLYPEGGPTAPEKSAALIKIHPDFNLNLVAAEPLIEKPISLDWDAAGRLWIAETPEYPNGLKIAAHKDSPEKENRPARDRISILEDSNGDGLMDKKTVFFEGLELVTSLVFYKDGVIVSQAPDIYWLRDTDGDGKADKKITLFTGFGTKDTHAVISNLRWGLDGWIYATVGYSRGDIYSGDRKTHFGNISDGVIRFRPDGSAIEQFSSKGSNTWGVDVAPDGEVFFSQANGNHVDHVVMPESALARGRLEGTTSFKVIEDHKSSLPIRDYKKQAYVQIDWVGGFTAAAGACIYNGGAWPEKYNGTFYVTEPTVNLLHQDMLKPDGASFTASRDSERAKEEFIASTDLWFRPVHSRVGPDGALYVLDFYNQAAVHNDTRGPQHGANNAAVRPDRDHFFGRIWRMQHKEPKKFEMPNLAKASAVQLVKALEHPNGWVRNTAQRLLIEQFDPSPSAEIVAALQALALNPSASDSARILAFWAREIAGGPGLNDLEFLAKGLSDPSANVRKNVAHICSSFPAGKSETGTAELSDALEKNIFAPDARVQLEALMGFSN